MENITEDKIKMLEERINTWSILIEELANLIKDIPDGDHPQKKPRLEILLDYQAKKIALEKYLEALTNQA